MQILHISDLHFGNQNQKFTPSQLETAFVTLFNDQIGNEELILLITGDIIYGGNQSYYQDASSFFRNVLSQTKLKRKNILLCPGNHDIIRGAAFSEFAAFAAGVRNDNTFSFNRNTCQLIQISNITFLGVNSAFKLDHTYGFVDIPSIESCLSAANLESSKIKIAFFHHHFLNLDEKDTSAIRNAYEVIRLLEYYGFQYLFHGHQHFSQTIVIGKNNMKSFGVRTCGFSALTNGINLYDISENNFHFKNFILDYKMHNGRQGVFFNKHIME